MRRRVASRFWARRPVLLGHGACIGSSSEPNRERGESGILLPPPGPSWAPRPETLGDLSAVAQVRGDRYLWHTEHGDVDFVPGVNMGSTTPGHQPGELAITARDVRRRLSVAGEMGFRAVRVYTIMPPHFYTELAAYNARHEDAPIYLFQGVYPPDESYVETGDLFDAGATAAFRDEIRDASGAVHGELTRAPRGGRASGTWKTDVGRWLAGWIIGAELDPEATAASDERNAGQPAHRGRYFATTGDATPTARWLAARMEELAEAEAGRGHAAPVAFINWATLDPLSHPEEPIDKEDMVGLDANTVEATDAWPAGTFASYHAYPYYPDFLRYEPGLQVEWEGREDPYAGYLMALEEHHADMPVMITEFGVPSSLGAAHLGPLGRHQGAHSEQEAMEMDADMLRIVRDVRLDGAFHFALTDEWFKFTWNTLPRQIPADRRQLWHDPLTNEQYFGMIATDPVGGEDARRRAIAETRELTVWTSIDESWVHLDLELAEPPGGPVALGFDVVPGGAPRLPDSAGSDGSADYAVVVDTEAGDAQAWVRSELDPVQLDGLPPGDLPERDGDWAPQQLTLNKSQVVPSTGQRVSAELFDVGDLRQGEMDPDHPDYDSRATWRAAEDGRRIRVRIPWGLLGMADPSSQRALVPEADGTAQTLPVERMGLTVEIGDRRFPTAGVAWQPWQTPQYRERLKRGVQTYVDTLYEVTPR